MPRSKEDITPSHPSFDRSKLSDGEYIEQLLFEVNELKATLKRKDLLIQSLQGNLPTSRPPEGGLIDKDDTKKDDIIPQRSARRRVKDDIPISKDNSLNDTSLSILSTSTSIENDPDPASNHSSIYSEEGLNIKQHEDITPVINNDSTTIDQLDDSTVEPKVSQESIKVASETHDLSQLMNHSNSSFLSYRSRIKLPSTLQQQAQTVQAQTPPVPPPVPHAATPVVQTPVTTTVAQSGVEESPGSHYTATPPLRGDREHNDEHLSYHNTHAEHNEPEHNEPPRIPLPQSPDETKSNVLSPGKGLTHTKTFRDLNIQSLKLDVPPIKPEATTLRSPAVITSGNNQLYHPLPQLPSSATTPNEPGLGLSTPRIFEGEYKNEAPRTPEAFYNNGVLNDSSYKVNQESMSNVSSPAIPPSQYSQASPATGYSYNGAFGYDSDPARTPQTTTDYLSQDSIYNLRNTSSISARNPTTKNGSTFLVNRNRANEDEETLFIKPEDFQTIAIVVVSTICPANSQGQGTSMSQKKLDEIYITLTINDKESGKEMWRIKKSLNQLIAFDNEIRPTVEYFGLPVLPDKSLFFSTTPNKIDIRMNGLQNYFNTLFVMPHIPHLILFRICKYLSLDFINPLDEFKSGSRKEGYLVRKYKGLGTSWKVRWCQVDGPILELYDFPGGSLLENINLVNCQIGRQSNDTVAEDKGYRHAFLIMESQRTSKLSSSLPKHFFCAETDFERDDWVSILIDLSVSAANSEVTSKANSIKDEEVDHTPRTHHDYQEDLLDSSKIYKSPAPLNVSHQTIETDRSAEIKDKKKKRSIFPFRNKTNTSINEVDDLPSPNTSGSFLSKQPTQEDTSIQLYLDKMGLDENMSKQIFGREVAQAFEISHHTFLGKAIPSICYRCIDFLIRTGAIYEEGIFRLSGSASTIRQLKEAFNKRYDIDLFEDELKPDIHTVSGLFKNYLRELPSPIITDKCYNDLRQIVSAQGNPSATSIAFRDYLSSNLDTVHYDLSYIIFKFLKEIINNKGTNKMNLRNVCIVFVPTLNISLDVLSLLLVDFHCIFENGDPVPDDQREDLDLNIPNF